jgi:hypothetical protein
MTSTITSLPTPSKDHSTCAWCAQHFASIVELIDHVDTDHLSAKRADGARRVA